jgi:hypothetical protein
VRDLVTVQSADEYRDLSAKMWRSEQIRNGNAWHSKELTIETCP